MVIQITEEFRISFESGVPHGDDKEAFSAFCSKAEDIRAALVDRIRKNTEGEDAVYAPCYHAVIDTGEEHSADIFAAEYFECSDADHLLIRRLKKAVKAAVASIPGAEAISFEGSAFEGSLLFFHELNDLITEHSDALNEECSVIYDGKDLLNSSLNTALLESAKQYSYVLSESNIRCSASGKGRKADVLKALDGKLGRLRLLMKETLMETLEEERGFHLFPGSFVSSYDAERHVLTTRFFDVIGFPPSLSREEAEKIIFRSYEEAGMAFDDGNGCNKLSHPVMSDTDIIPSNPGRFFIQLRDKAEAFQDGERDLDTAGLRYF